MPSLRGQVKSVALIGGLAVLAGMCAFLQLWWTQTSLDISVYWEAGTRMRQGGAALYWPSVDPSNQVGTFIYPPLFATLFAPLTWLPRRAGYALWTLIELGLLVAAFEGARRLAGVSARRDLALWLLASLWGAIWMNLVEGQVNLLVAALLAWGLYDIEQRRNRRGTLLLAAAIHVKIVPVVLLPVLIVQGRWRAVLSCVAWCTLLWFAPIVWIVPGEGLAGGIERNVALTGQYWKVIAAPRLTAQNTDTVGGVRAPNNSLPAVWQRYFSENQRLSRTLEDKSPLLFALPASVARWGGLAIAALMGIGALVAAWLRRNEPQDRALAAGLALIAGMLANLLFWPHHMCASVILLAPLFPRLTPRQQWAVAAGLILLAWLPINEQLAPLAWLGAWGTPTWAILGVWALALWKTLLPPSLIPRASAL